MSFITYGLISIIEGIIEEESCTNNELENLLYLDLDQIHQNGPEQHFSTFYNCGDECTNPDFTQLGMINSNVNYFKHYFYGGYCGVLNGTIKFLITSNFTTESSTQQPQNNSKQSK